MMHDVLGNDISSVKELLNLGEKPESLLILASEEGSYDIVKFLLSYANININAKNYNGQTALIIAVEKGYDSIVNLLISTVGINVNVESLHRVYSMSYKQYVSYYKDHDYDNYRRTQSSFIVENALSIAVSKRRRTIVKKLLSAPGVDLTNKNNFANTPVMIASENGDVTIVRLLFRKIISSKIDLNSIFNIDVYNSATIKVLKYLLYSGIINHTRDLYSWPDNASYYSDVFAGFLRSIKNRLLLLANLTARKSERFSLFDNFPLYSSYRVAPNLPYRVGLLEARLCGIGFEENITVSHTGMSILKFRMVSSLMRASVCTKLSHGVNNYFFVYILMMRQLKGSMFADWFFNMKCSLLEFIVGSKFVISRQDFFSICPREEPLLPVLYSGRSRSGSIENFNDSIINGL